MGTRLGLAVIAHLVVLGVLGCPEESKDSADTEPSAHDTGWAVYEAPGDGWSELQPAADYLHLAALDPSGRVTFSGCDDEAPCDDGACRRDCTGSPGWWESLGPLTMLAIPDWESYHWTLGMPEPWLVVDTAGTAWRRTDSDTPEARRASGWEDPTSLGGLEIPYPCWCASFADRDAQCDCQDGSVDPELLDHIAGAIQFSSTGYSLAFVRDDGTAGFASLFSYGTLGGESHAAVSILRLNIIAADTSGALHLYNYVDLASPVLPPLVLGPEPGEVAAFGAGDDHAHCWVDPTGQLHFAWRDWSEADQEEENWPLRGPKFSAVPSSLVCDEWLGCAIVEGRLQCWSRTLDGEPYYPPYFSDLMLTSGTRVQ